MCFLDSVFIELNLNNQHFQELSGFKNTTSFGIDK